MLKERILFHVIIGISVMEMVFGSREFRSENHNGYRNNANNFENSRSNGNNYKGDVEKYRSNSG